MSTETKWTPEKWLLHTAREPICVYADDSAGCAIAIAGEPLLPPRSAEETLANMTLMLHAKDLYSALENVMAGLERGENPYGHDCQWCGKCCERTFTEARAAMAKARGEA